MKSTVDKLGVDKSACVPVDLKKLSDVVDNYVVKKLNITNYLKKLMPLEPVNLSTKQIIMLRSKILKIKYLVLLLLFLVAS